MTVFFTLISSGIYTFSWRSREEKFNVDSLIETLFQLWIILASVLLNP